MLAGAWQTVLVPPRKDVQISAVLHTLLQERTARQAAEQLFVSILHATAVLTTLLARANDTCSTSVASAHADSKMCQESWAFLSSSLEDICKAVYT